MGARSTAARRIPGDPLGGVLRQTARLARRPTRPAPGTAATDEPTAAGCPDTVATCVAAAVASLVTDGTGVAVWYFTGLNEVPMVVATATDPVPIVVTVQQVDQSSATLAAWFLDGSAAQSATISAVAFRQPAPGSEALD